MFEDLHYRWLSLEVWWYELPPNGQAFLRAVGIFVAAFLLAKFLGLIVRRTLRHGSFDAALRAPWLPSANKGQPDSSFFRPTRLLGILVKLSVWAGAVWLVANEQGWTGLARGLETVAL